jgi:hypothetical protein
MFPTVIISVKILPIVPYLSITLELRPIGRILLTYGRNFLGSDIVGGGIFLVS